MQATNPVNVVKSHISYGTVKRVNATPPRVGPIALPTLKNALYIPIFFPIFSGFGPAIGGFIESFGGYHLLFVFGLIMGIISLGISLFLKNIKYDGKIGKVPLTTSNTLLIQLSLIALLLFVVQSQETVTLTNYAHNKPEYKKQVIPSK